eukprot:COSAG01_NODE_340_length_18638_cov_56.516505_19_plen_74_part_00
MYGSLPLGDTRPSITSARASPPRGPGKKAFRKAAPSGLGGAASSGAIETAPPLIVTTWCAVSILTFVIRTGVT